MDSLKNNKYFAALLIALLVALVASLIGDALVTPQNLKKNVYIVEGIDQEIAQGQIREEPKGPEDLTELFAHADPEKGKGIARRCVQCHSFEEGGKHKIGPALWGIYEEKMHHHKDYSYSKAAQDMEGLWGLDHLNKFLYNPRQFMPGTKMSFAGLRNAEERAHLIKYMSTLK